MSALAPGSTLGILGGGQLGRLIALEAARLGFDVHVFTPQAGDPAVRVCAQGHIAAWDDAPALADFARACDLVTLEFENVPLASVRAIEAAGTPVRPGARALEVSQDRAVEKTFLNSLGIATVDWRRVDDLAGLPAALGELGGRGILKRRREGYDGKGQALIRTPADAEAAWNALGGAPCILEAFAPFDCEISALVARSATGETAVWDCPRNDHEGGILARSTLPSGVAAKTERAAQAAALRLAGALDYAGVLALEFFVMPDGRLLANEFAPRVHNSGHWTPEGAYTGQFEQHVRAICGWPLGNPGRHSDVVMENLVGPAIATGLSRVSADARLTHYAKREARAGRKMGHVVTRRGPALTRPD